MITEVGIHKVQHANIMDGIENLMGNDLADFIYSDPPWGQGNLRYWQTMNKKMTGAEKIDIDYRNFLTRYFEIIQKYAKDRIILEYGCKWRNDIIEFAQSFEFFYHGTRTCFYQSGKRHLPCDLHFLSKSGDVNKNEIPSDEDIKDLRDLNLIQMLWEMYAPQDCKIVLDPMCGMGFSAEMSLRWGAAFRGNELNSARLEKTIKRLSKNL